MSKRTKLFNLTLSKDTGSCSACNSHNISDKDRGYKDVAFYDLQFASSNMLLHFCKPCLIIFAAVIGQELIAPDNNIERDY